MDRRHQPAMHTGVGAPQHWPGAEYEIDDDDEWYDPTALSRGLALGRLGLLIVAVGLGAGIVIGLALALAFSALESSV